MVTCPFCKYEFSTWRGEYYDRSSANKNLKNHIIHCKENPNRIPYVCEACKREFEKRHSFNGHKAHCGKTRPKKYNTNGRRKRPKVTKCPFCEYSNNNYLKLGGHIGSCKKKPNYNDWVEKIRKASTGKKAKDESKIKISKSRIKYLIENPDKVPYLMHHSSKESYPEKIFRIALIENNIQGWIQEYRNGIYSYDFAFVEHKIDIEIDGNTHRSEKVKKIDERRDLWSKEQGWRVIRISAKEVKDNVNKCIEKIQFTLNKNFNNIT